MKEYKTGDHSLIHDRMHGSTIHEDKHNKHIHNDMHIGSISHGLGNKSTFEHDSHKNGFGK